MEENMAAMTTPDWILISRDGIHQLLQLTLELFLQVTSNLRIVHSTRRGVFLANA